MPDQTLQTADKTGQTNMRGVIPHLSVEGASEASAFYQRAFGAKELSRIPADDGKRLIHCHLEINGGSLMLADCFPERGYGYQPSHSFSMVLSVDDIDSWWKRAIDAGAKETMPVQKMFWGDRYGQMLDPFGVMWAMDEPAKPA